MNKYLRIGLAIFAAVLTIILVLVISIGGGSGWFDTTCIRHNCQTHSCNVTADCSDVYCPYKGAVLGGGRPSGCYITQECSDEADANGLNLTDVGEYCKDSKQCKCRYL